MSIVHALAVPPANLLLLALCGVILWKRKPRLARWLVATAGVLLWVTATPLFGGALLRSLQIDAPLAPGVPWPDADAVVVLAAGSQLQAPEYGGPTVDRVSLERLRYGAVVQQVTGRPLCVTGGPSDDDLPPVAELMRRVLEDELDVRVTWVEREARNTWENASLSAPLLRDAGVRRVYLVTHAWHLPRARACFEAVGFEVVAAPTGFRAVQGLSFGAFLPSRQGVRDTSWACHEWLGRLWYALTVG